MIEFDVELNAVPVEKDKVGKEVTVNWVMYDKFDANKTFWSDSNGLEMQQRTARSFNSSPTPAIQNVSSSYYPVTTAIAIRDHNFKSKIQMTVMNDRTQGGSANLRKNTIELLQQRRLLQDGSVGKFGEAVDEKDGSGHGAKVNARYHVQIFDIVRGKSKQRERQLHNSHPVQYFFAMDLEEAQEQPSGLQWSPKV